MRREGQTRQGSKPRRKAKRETRLLLGTKHVLDGNYVIRPEKFFGEAKFVTMNTPQKFQECQFRLYYEIVL